MRRPLILHPDFSCPAVDHIEVDIARHASGRLGLAYRIAGAIADLRIAPPAAPARTDNLWKTTCCEAFVRAPSGAPYCEFNLSPSGQWAAYHFGAYRAGMKNAPGIPAPHITARARDELLELHAEIDLSNAPDIGADAPWRLALTCVIETAQGEVSYWALGHPPGKPDFHHLDGFSLDLPTAEQP